MHKQSSGNQGQEATGESVKLRISTVAHHRKSNATMDFAKVTAEAAEQSQSQKGEPGYGFGGNQEVEFSAIMIQPGIGSEGMDGASAFDGIGDRN